VEAMISSISQRFGQLDVLVNNAGVMANAVFSLIPEEDWDRIIAVHLKGTYLCSKFASALMIEQRRGVIVNMGSICAFRPLVGQSNYAAAKAGIVTLTKSVAKELGRWNIRANCIAPGYIQSDLMDTFATSEEDKRMFKQIPLGRVGTPGDVADLALFLASDESRYITGETIRIDGGLSI
jgi:3-oxoacyl-[acyl-carrier protein] reductase